MKFIANLLPSPGRPSGLVPLLLLLLGLATAACSLFRKSLLELSYSGSCAEVIASIQKGADVNVRDDDGMTPLHKAADWGKDEVVRLLIERGARVDARNSDGQTPLHRAASALVVERRRFPQANLYPDREGQTRVTALLLAAGADVNATDGRGETALHVAARDSSLETARVLIAARANVNARRDQGATPLHEAVRGEAVPAVVEQLLTSGADPNARDDRGNTALHYMLFPSLFDAGVVALLLRAGADPSARNADGLTPLELVERDGTAARREAFRAALGSGAGVPAPPR